MRRCRASRRQISSSSAPASPPPRSAMRSRSRGTVVLLERESQPGYHSTGRSAALFIESYGTPQVRALTMASRAFLEQPPAGFADAPILAPRGVLMVATADQLPMLDEQWEVLRSIAATARRLDVAEACERGAGAAPRAHRRRRARARRLRHRRPCAAPGLPARPAPARRSRRRRRRGARARAARRHLARRGRRRRPGRRRSSSTPPAPGATWSARLAGAQPIGLVPKRRSAFVFAPPPGVVGRALAGLRQRRRELVREARCRQLLGSPANADPVEPHDVQPEELDIALAIDRIER